MVSVLPREGFITAKELASFLGISEPSVKAYVKRNNIHFVVIGKKWLIDLSQFGARPPAHPRSHTETRESGVEAAKGGEGGGLKKLKKKAEEAAQIPAPNP